MKIKILGDKGDSLLLIHGWGVNSEIWGSLADQLKNFFKKNKADLVSDIKRFFNKQCNHAINSGIKESNIMIDPGIGFGKTFDHNFTLLKRLKEFEDLGFPILIGSL